MNKPTHTALRLTDVTDNDSGGWDSEQYDIIADDEYTGIQDNGGYPDGNAWYIWPVEWPTKDANLLAAVKDGAEFIGGFVRKYDSAIRDELDHYCRVLGSDTFWSGIDSEREAFFNSESLADYCDELMAKLP